MPKRLLRYAIIVLLSTAIHCSKKTDDPAVDTTGPVVLNVTSSTSNGGYNAGDTVSIQLTFDEEAVVSGTPTLTLETGGTDAVATYASGSGTTELTFTYTVGASENSADLDYASASALSGEISDTFANVSDNALPTPGAAGSLGANKAIVIDTTTGTVSRVTSSTNNGSYNAGQIMSIQVVFSEAVYVTGTPTLKLETGPTDRTVNYVSGSGTTDLTFEYNIQATDTTSDLQYFDTSSLSLNGGTIVDIGGNNATLTLPATNSGNSLAELKTIVVDTTAPTVSGVNSSTANGTYNSGQAISIQVTFSETVVVSGTPVLTLETGTTDRNATYTSGSNSTVLTFTYTTQSGDSTADLDYKANNSLALSGGTIIDAATNSATLTLPDPGQSGSLGANKAIVIDAVSPSVSSLSSTDAGTFKAGQSISIQVNFSKAVTVAGGTPQLTLETGSTDRTVNYASGSGTSTLTFTYTVQAGDNSTDLDTVSTNSLTLNGATIKDSGGNDASLTLPTPGQANSLSNGENLIVDTTGPTVTSVTASTANGSYYPGDSISIQVVFSETVQVEGTPTLTLETGTSDAVVNYVSGDNSDTITFTYTISTGHRSDDLDAASTSALTAGTSITDNIGNNATLTLPIGGTSGSLASNKAIIIDGGYAPQAYIKPQNAGSGDNFGTSVAISGDTLVVGANNEDCGDTYVTNGSTFLSDDVSSNAGAAYVFSRSGTQWSHSAYLKASNAEANDSFGNAVAIDGDTIAVAAQNEDSNLTTITNGSVSNASNGASNAGAVYIFKRSGSDWAQESYIKAPNAGSQDNFGRSISISGDTLVVGAQREDSTSTGIINGSTAATDNAASNADIGAAYVYLRTGSVWAAQAYLKAPVVHSTDQFGISVSASSNTILIGAYGEDAPDSTITNGSTASTATGLTNSGAAYVFVRSGSIWAQQAYLKAPNAGSSDFFGFSVSVDGDTAAVGAYQECSNGTTVINGTGGDANDANASQGAAYVFKRSGSTWSNEAYLKASNGEANDQFGFSVKVISDTIVVGANAEASNVGTITNGSTASTNNDAANAGAVYVFKRSGSSWTQRTYIKAANNGLSDAFGAVVTASTDSIVVGVASEDSNQTTITNGTSATPDDSLSGSGAVYVYR